MIVVLLLYLSQQERKKGKMEKWGAICVNATLLFAIEEKCNIS